MGEDAAAWKAIDITVKPEAAEAVEFAFNELGSPGTEINNLRKRKNSPVTVAGYFNVLPKDSALQEALEAAFRIYELPAESLIKVAFRNVENTDWLAEWKKHWKPTVAGKFVIAPPWENADETDKILITIEPNMAFGTGTHETTQLCLDAISKHFRADQTFLDVGTGTGILAIAAAKIASTASDMSLDEDVDRSQNGQSAGSQILACDTDSDSVYCDQIENVLG